MNIGHAAKACGVSAKLIRHYDSIDVLHRASRSAAGYRVYDPQDAHMLRLIGCARRVGFMIGQTKRLLKLWQDADPASAEVKAIALDHINTFNERIEELRAMRDILMHLVQHCDDAKRPELPDVEKANAHLNDRCCPGFGHPIAIRD